MHIALSSLIFLAAIALLQYHCIIAHIDFGRAIVNTMIRLTSLISAVALAPPAFADTFVEPFDTGGANAGTWTYGIPVTYPGTGGNPGRYQRTTNLDTFAPQPRTQSTTSVFTGNYREAYVTSVGLDLNTFAVDFSAAERPLTVMLVSNNGTAANTNDDWAAYFMGAEEVPVPGDGWKSFDFDIPSQETSLPKGWNIIKFGPSAPATPDWNNVITNVTRLQYFYGDPEFFFIFQNWTLGIDNARITTTPPPPDVPGDTTGDGIVDVDDILLIINDWGKCKDPENCPGDLTDNGIVDLDDLLEVINNWS